MKLLLLFLFTCLFTFSGHSYGLEIRAHNNFISFTTFNAASSSKPVILLDYAWGEVLGIELFNGGIRSLVSNVSAINESLSPPAKLTMPPLFYPSPFRFSEGSELGYQLNKHMDIEVRVYDIRANEIFRKSYAEGQNGGLFGYNKVPFNESVVGKPLPAGVYIYLVMTGNTVLGRGKFAVLP